MTNTFEQLTVLELDTAFAGYSRDVATATANRWARSAGQYGGIVLGSATFGGALMTSIAAAAPALALGGFAVGATVGAGLGWVGGYAYGAYQTRGR